VIVDIVKLLVPLRKGLQIHRPEILDPPLPQMRHEMATDEAAGTRDENVRLGMRISMQGLKLRGFGSMNQSRKALHLLDENNVAVGPKRQKAGKLLKQKCIDFFDS